MKLTETRILKLECPAGKKDILVKDDTQRGLYLRVSNKARAGVVGARTYLCQYTIAGQKRREPIDATTLATAQAAAAAIMGAKALGRDPAAERKAKAKAAKVERARVELTLAALIKQWSALHLAGKRSRYASEAVRAIRHAFPKQLPLPAADLDRETVARVLEQLKAAGNSTMAARTIAYGRACYQDAITRSVLTVNPFTGHKLPATTRRRRVLSDDELRAIWQATTKPGSFNSIVRMLLMTGARREEVAGMVREELSTDGLTWTLPEERAKNGLEHIIPLSRQARAIIEAAPRYSNRFVFPGLGSTFNGFGRAKDRLDEASGVSSWRLHDLRRTVATRLQKLGVQLQVTEALLNHISGSRSGIVGVYQLHDWADEKRAALEAWGNRLQEIVEGREAGGNVIAMRATA